MFQCPQKPCTEAVAVDFGTFADTTVTVEACSKLKAHGYQSYTIKKSQAAKLVPGNADTGLRHKEGLVTFV